MSATIHQGSHPVSITPRTFKHLAAFEGLSHRSIRRHIELYQGYVHKYNELSGKLRGLLSTGDARSNADAESLKVDITFTLGAIKNHELLFDTLGEGPEEPRGALAAEIVNSFHSIPQFLMDLKQTAVASRGWAWTACDMDYGHLFNYAGGAMGAMPVWNAVPILAIDLAGHAYFYDFGDNKVAYVESAMQAISWDRVGRRFEQVVAWRAAMKNLEYSV